jgi:monovalent cation:H+ antiporter-2, CPA2 family
MHPETVLLVTLAGQLAEIGVVLLMFGVGLHFSPGDLLKVRRIALPGALLQMVASFGIGFAQMMLDHGGAPTPR